MRSVQKYILRKLANSLTPYLLEIFKKHKYFKEHNTESIKYGKEIRIGEDTTVAKDAKVEIRFGGTISIGKQCYIQDGVLILSYGGNIQIGNRCSISPYTIVYGHGNTKIGNNVIIAGHCMIIPNNHNFGNTNLPIRDQGNSSKGIVVEDDVWIAHGCSILDGVTIGKGSVIAAGSVLITNVPPYSVFGGVPARLIKKIKNENS